MNIKVKKLSPTAILPTKGSNYSAGYDLYVDTDKETIIQPHKTVKLFTGLAMEIPNGYFGAIFARSGIATNKGLRPPNCVGVIDSDYRGNIGIALHNDLEVEQIIFPYERIAQIIIMPYLEVNFIEKELSETQRGINGFGSTGRI